MKIEKGIPIPTTHQGRKPAPCPYPFDKMEVGDSFVVRPAANDTLRRLANRLGNWARRCGKDRFSIITRWDEADNSMRVWKIAYVPSRRYKRKPKPLAGIANLVFTPEPKVRTHRLSDDEPKQPKREKATA